VQRKIIAGEIMFRLKLKILIAGLAVLVFIFTGATTFGAAGKKHLIVIDPAHGGEDGGVRISDKLAEKDVTLAIALALKKRLAGDGRVEVVLTRDSDITLSPDSRRENISKLKPDMMISIHVNAGFGREAAGFEIYYQGLNDGKLAGKRESSRNVNESIRLAQIIQKNMETLFPRGSRGLRAAKETILAGLNIPALVMETGFATNPEEEKKLISPEFQSAIAGALAKSISSYF
jgi:N-acetylmuramoyl-L-alanine amidase